MNNFIRCECRSNGNLKQAWVNGGCSHDSLKVAWKMCTIRSWRRNGRREGLGEARFVKLANLARQLHRSCHICCFFPLWTGNHCGCRLTAEEAPGVPQNVERCRCHVSQMVFLFCMHVNTFFFLTLGLHTVLVSSLTCGGLLFQDFITTYSVRGLAAVFTETGVHGAPDLRRARTGDSTGGRATFDRGREWLALRTSHISQDKRSFHFVQPLAAVTSSQVVMCVPVHHSHFKRHQAS